MNPIHDADLSALSPEETIEQLGETSFPPYITLAHLFNAPPGWAIRHRTMKQYVLQYVVDGMAEYPVEERDYLTKRGDLLFHRPGERHSILTVEGFPYVCISIVFHFGAASCPVESVLQDTHLLGNFLDHPIHEQLSQLVVHYQQPGAHHQTACQGLLLHILASAAEAVRGAQSDAESVAAPKHLAKLVLVKNYIARHYDQELSFPELERISGLSKNYITIQFKQSFGMTPSQYLLSTRVNQAKELALHTDLSIGEIAQRIGYADVHTFGRMFKQKTGYSLSRFCSTLFRKG